MLGSIFSLLVYIGVTLAQETTSLHSGTKLLWIPFQTIPGTPLASIAETHSDSNQTVYVISCPTAQPDCQIAPNITLTEGDTTAGYSTANDAGTAFLGCSIAGPTNAVCSDVASGTGGDVQRGTTSTLAPSQIVYQAVKVTATNNDTSTTSSTSTSTSMASSGQSTGSSTAGGVATSGPWSIGGALGAGLLALAVL